MNERPTFSPFWHRVRAMKPRLRPHVEVTRQRYRGRRWYVAHDPASNQFYRLNPVANDFVGMLDGQRDVETAWKASLSKFGDSAPTQNEVIQLISQLYNANLLSIDTTPETEQLLRRGRERLKKKITGQAIGLMYFKIRLFNPDPIFRWMEPIARPLINRWVFLAWAAFVSFTLFNLWPYWEQLSSGFSTLLVMSNWLLVAAVWIVTKAFHESGHGLICRRFGGQVPEFGAMMLVLLPSPYVDASSCWAFPSKWRRIAVGAGGMIFELAIASAAAWYWMWAVDSGRGGELPAQLAFYCMLIASVSTILFNANPLMRFDGYYILADLLETPNLMQRSNKMLQFLFQKHVYRLKNLTPPSTQPGEQATLVVYGILAFLYRIFLFISITLFLIGKLFIVGVLLAVWSGAAWFLLPLGKLVHWLATSPTLSDKRGRTVMITLATAALIALVFGVIPMPDHRRGWGVIESADRTSLYIDTEGFVTQVHARPGQHVRRGEPILTMENPEMIAQRRGAVAAIDELQIEERAAVQRGDAGIARIARDRLEVMRETLEELDRRLGNLVLVAPHDGVIVAGDPEHLLGAYAEKGKAVCQVADPTRVHIAASLDQAQSSWLFSAQERGPGAPAPEGGGEHFSLHVRLKSDAWTDFPAVGLRTPRAGQRELPHQSLAISGGGLVETEADDRSGRLSKRPRFTVYVDPAPEEPRPEWALGERVRLRFTLTPKPLLSQWIDRFWKALQGRADV